MSMIKITNWIVIILNLRTSNNTKNIKEYIGKNINDKNNNDTNKHLKKAKELKCCDYDNNQDWDSSENAWEMAQELQVGRTKISIAKLKFNKWVLAIITPDNLIIRVCW